MFRHLTCFLLSAAYLPAQSPINNPGFEQGEPGQTPPGWTVPKVLADAGFTAALVEGNCRTGARCAVVNGIPNAGSNMFGNLAQILPATGYNNRRIRLRSALRVEGTGTRAQMWLRLDRADKMMVSLDNMGDRPITSPNWNTYDIEAQVTPDTERLVFGVMLFGPGKVWIDDFSIEIIGEFRTREPAPARPLTERGLRNITAFARLYGYTRFFHPSDQGEKIEWQKFAIDGVQRVEDAPDDGELAARLRALLEKIAPTVQIYPSGKAPALPAAIASAPSDSFEFIHFYHRGVGLPESAMPPSYKTYNSLRVKKPAGKLPDPFRAELVPGLFALVPLALYVTAGGTLPHLPEPPPSTPELYSANDRSTRLGGIVIAWNIFQHFYPYFDVVKANWPAELTKALQAAANGGEAEYVDTLRRLVAALQDGHGSVSGGAANLPRLVPPVQWDWIGNQAIVTRVWAESAPGIVPGDAIVSIDGKPVPQIANELRPLISAATPQLLNFRMVNEMAHCAVNAKSISLTVEPFLAQGTRKTIELACAPPGTNRRQSHSETRPEVIAELEPGILYMDLQRITEPAWKEAIPRFAQARGLIFDLRGYPNNVALEVLMHLADSEIRSARWNIPAVTKPDRIGFTFLESGWPLQPRQPHFKARRAFLTDGRAISYAETVMGIVEHFKLAQIVGQPTAGTNGNVNAFKLPGGYRLNWTGMKVLKHDGSQHHGIGIIPTIPVTRTRKGIAGEKDEILERAIAVVKAE